MPRHGWNPKRCKDCGRSRDEVGHISNSGLCVNCAAIRMVVAMEGSIAAARNARLETVNLSGSELTDPPDPYPPSGKARRGNTDRLDSEATDPPRTARRGKAGER